MRRNQLAEMRLMTHAITQHNGAERLTRREDEALSDLDAWAREIIARRDAKRGLEDGAMACRRGANAYS